MVGFLDPEIVVKVDKSFMQSPGRHISSNAELSSNNANRNDHVQGALGIRDKEVKCGDYKVGCPRHTLASLWCIDKV